MRILTGRNVERDFRGQAIERDFQPEVNHRNFIGKNVLRKFGTHDPTHIHPSESWLWGDTDKILSEIEGTFASVP